MQVDCGWWYRSEVLVCKLILVNWKLIVDDDIDLKCWCMWRQGLWYMFLSAKITLLCLQLLAACFFFFVFFIAVGFNNIYFIHVLGIYIFLVLLWNSTWLFVTFALLLWFPVLIQLNLFIICPWKWLQSLICFGINSCKQFNH